MDQSLIQRIGSYLYDNTGKKLDKRYLEFYSVKMEFLVLFATGLCVGLISAFFGIGGGSLMIPVLYALFPSLPPASIISISLGTIVLNSALNSWRFHQKGLSPEKESALIIFCFAAIGAYAGAHTVYLIHPLALKKIFGLILLAMAIRVATERRSEIKEAAYKPNSILLGITCLIGSLISSITGLGGGAIFVPFFLSLVKLPVNLVAPYSNAAMMAASLIGLLPHFFIRGDFHLGDSLAQKSFIGHVNIFFILCLFSGAFFSSKLGIKLHGVAKANTKKWLLSSLLLVLALRILVN